MCPAGTYQTFAGGGEQQICRECEAGTLQPHRGQDSCIGCPSGGVNCRNRKGIEVLAGYYLHELPPANATYSTEPFTVWRCALEAACLGGTVPGQTSCAEGHEDALCGMCADGYSRGRQACEPCSSDSGGAELYASLAVASVFLLLLVVSSAMYLVRSAHALSPSAPSTRFPRLRQALNAIASHSDNLGTIVRILLGCASLRPPPSHAHTRSHPLACDAHPSQVHAVHRCLPPLLPRALAVHI
jgi:hypothetical protein